MNYQKHIKVFQDGKVCRDVDAVITEIRSGGIKVEFDVDDEHVAAWSRRRKHRGYHVYEVIGWNYWILPYYSNPANLAKHFER